MDHGWQTPVETNFVVHFIFYMINLNFELLNNAIGKVSCRIAVRQLVRLRQVCRYRTAIVAGTGKSKRQTNGLPFAKKDAASSPKKCSFPESSVVLPHGY